MDNVTPITNQPTILAKKEAYIETGTSSADRFSVNTSKSGSMNKLRTLLAIQQDLGGLTGTTKKTTTVAQAVINPTYNGL